MKVELHLHTNRYSACAVHTPDQAMRKLIATGYEAVFVTEHDAVWSDEELARLREEFPAIRILPGVELSPFFYGSYHLLVLGSNDPEYLSLRDVADILAKARAEECLTVLAHPFRWEGGDEMLVAGHRPDALECQSPNVTPAQAERAREAAEKLGLPAVNSGDVHALDFIDQFWIETAEPVETARDIRRIVLAGQYENVSREGG